MIKKTITYTDFDGGTHTEDFYFNISKVDLVDLEVSEKAGFVEQLQQAIKDEDAKTLIGGMKKIILLAYGIKSEDGKRFLKNDQIREDFESSAAFGELLMELLGDLSLGAEFINGIFPKDMVDQAKASGLVVENVELPAEPETPIAEATMDAVREAAGPEIIPSASMTVEEFEAWKAQQPQ